MYRSILVAYDGTAESRSALLECIRLNPPPSTQIHLLAIAYVSPAPLMGEYVTEATYSSIEEQTAIEKSKLSKAVDEGCKLLQDAELQVVSHVEAGEPADVIRDMADHLDVDLVIVGHHRHKSWVQRWWRGSTDAVLLEKLRCTLMIAADFPSGKRGTVQR
ncbi:Nucleotide-binding universal stress protein, UspA family [Noviherbaspirillum humi]|uniref:Nucleotide-binding universal stress protein, UspA family n=1 Tax=Noviherbaspirillum humi TaxID=1688639 RepID=A0A239LJE9_9BURK|nr:universal stress protein [Noviherbaspirillum humi]SNT30797.1 Nucleotide-binding universal stress protein, UspA family [Noviherbaspirillum humi]